MSLYPDGSKPSPEEVKGQNNRQNGTLWSRWLHFSGLQGKLIIPYVLLTLLLATVGTYIVTRLVTSSIGERLVNQLYDSSRAATTVIERRERKHLEDLRLMAFTKGVAQAMEERDRTFLRDYIFPIEMNNHLDILTAVDLDGQEIITWGLDQGSGQYTESQGGDFSSYEVVNNVLDGVVDQVGDKFVGLLDTPRGQALVTSAPVRDADGALKGVLLVGSYLKTVIDETKQEVQADIVILDSNHDYVESTVPKPGENKPILEEVAQQVTGQGLVSPSRIKLFSGDSTGDYQMTIIPFVIRKQQVGWMGVILPSNFVVSTEATSRNTFSWAFTLGTIAVILIGYILAQSIARPILRLRSMSQEVAAGNLNQSIGLTRSDEIGELASAFDQMTLQLRERTAEAARLYAETIQRNKELAETNAKLQAMQLQLIQSEKLAAVGQLTAGIVHDVKNPLTVIKGMSEILQEDESLDPAVRKDLKVINESAVKANRIVTDLLKFARQSTPEMQQRDLRETVEAALRLTAYLIKEARTQLVTDLPEEPVMVTYDPQQIEQVLINLIHNGVQANSDHGTLRVTLRSNQQAAAIAIQDTGVGITPENLTRIFDPFFTTKPEGVGTGLGLSVSYGIVANHRGRIDVESEVGKGTTFTILLPVDQTAPLPVET